MPARLEYSIVKKNIEQKGHILLSDDYVNGKTPLKYICGICGNIAYQMYSRLMADINHGCKKVFTVLHMYLCEYCGNTFYTHRRNTIYCNKECAMNSKRCTFEGLKLLREYGRKGGRMSNKVKRSKNEILFYNLCKSYFTEFNVLSNEPMFDGYDADVVITDIKLAIEWNGPWHYKQVHKHHDLTRTLRNDIYKKNKIEKYGYKLYIIKDIRGDENIKFVKKQFELFKMYVSSILK